ncbi:MAG: hypothetical protein WB622_01635 [Acidobacteriaceae bacterium]
MDEIWIQIVADALERGLRETKGRPVPGAKLRKLVGSVAAQYGQSYPPAAFEGSSFSDFLKECGSILIVLKRPAQDLLVAPAAQPELLLNISSQGVRAEIRQDVFEAFTRIPRDGDTKSSWYESQRDRFLWLDGESATANDELVPGPRASREQEIDDRRSFVESSVQAGETRDELLKILAEPGNSGLWAFSNMLRKSGLSRKWHEFRFQRVTGRIRAWSEHAHQVWRDDWLVAGEISASRKAEPATSIESAADRARRGGLQGLFSRMDEADLQRITVPLDIVIKWMGK